MLERRARIFEGNAGRDQVDFAYGQTWAHAQLLLTCDHDWLLLSARVPSETMVLSAG